jgi:hypothetical protein
MEVVMSIEKIENIMEFVSANTRIKVNARKQPDPQPGNTRGDVISIGNSSGASNIEKISWPPLFPIGDAQCIFKVEK